MKLSNQISKVCTFFILLSSLAFYSYIKYYATYGKTSIKWAPNDELVKHCNFLEHIHIGEEANTLEEYGLQLEKTIVVIRHGDRAPLRKVKDLDDLQCDKGYLKNGNSEEKFYSDLVAKFFENSQNLVKWNVSRDFSDLPTERCKLSRLTKFGVSQHIKLGYLLSETYSHKLGLTEQTLPNWLKVTTTKYSRTFQSAFSFLYGFHTHLKVNIFDNFPNFTYSHDPYFCGHHHSSPFCTKTCHTNNILSQDLHVENLLDPNDLNTVNEIVEELRHIVAPSAGESIKFKSLLHIYDALNAYLCHQEELPCHSTYGCILPDRAKNVLSYVCLLGKKLQNSRSYKHSHWLKIYGFLNGLVEEMQQLNSKFVLYSGHDISLESLKSTLSLSDCFIPSYASRLVFEVYSKSGAKYIRIIYNGIDVTSNLDVDSLNLGSAPHVKLVDVVHFKEYIHRNFELYTNTKDYKAACAGLGSMHSTDSTVAIDEGRL